MNSKGHFWISFIKSMIRIVACTVAIGVSSIIPLALGLMFAEVLGIFEEVVDKR